MADKKIPSWKKYYLKNREKILQKRKEKYRENWDILTEKRKAYRSKEEVKAMMIAYDKKYRLTNRDKIKASQKKYRDKNKGKRKEYMRNWASENRDKVRSYVNKRKRWVPVVNGKEVRKCMYFTKEDALKYPNATDAAPIRKY